MMRAIRIVMMVLSAGTLHGQTDKDLGRFEECRVSDRLWLSASGVEVAVEPEVVVEITTPGTLDWHVADGSMVKSGQVLGYMTKSKLDLTRRDLELKKNRYANALADLESGVEEKRRALTDGISELELKRQKMELTEEERRTLGVEFADRLEKERKKIDELIQKQKEKLSGAYFDDEVRNQREALNMDLEKASFDYEEQLKAAEIVAPCDGVFKIMLREIRKEDNEAAVITREDVAEARLEMTDLRWSRMRPEELEIALPGDNGTVYRGEFERVAKEKSYTLNAEILVFAIRAGEDGKPPVPAMSGRRVATLYRKLEKPGHILDKKNLLFKHPEEIRTAGWAGFVEKRWRGVKVRLVGPREIVIDRLNEN